MVYKRTRRGVKLGTPVPSYGLELGKRISVVANLFRTRQEAAEAADISTNQLARYIKGANSAAFPVLARLAVAKGIDLNWLATGDGQMIRDDPSAYAREALVRKIQRLDDADAALPSDFVLVPRYDIEASAGPGTFADTERVVDHLAFNADFVRRTLHLDPHHLVLITAVGDSMEPIIRSGDLLLIDTSVAAFLEDAIYVVSLGEILMVKRVQRFFNGAVTVKSDNAAYVEQTLSAEETATIHVAGRVRWIGRLI